MRIMHVTQCLGGVETYLRSFHSYGAFDGFKVRVLVVPGECTLADEWRSAGGTVEVVAMRREVGLMADIQAMRCLWRLLRKHRPDVVHLHSSKAGAIGRAVAFGCKLLGQRMAVVYTPHAYYYLALVGWRRWLFLQIEKMLAGFTDLLLATSPSEGQRSLVDVGYGRARVCAVANGVALCEQSIRTRGENVGLKIIFVGRICHQKNVELLVRVISAFRGQLGVHFLIVGVGHYREDRQVLDDLLLRESVDMEMVEIIPWLNHASVQELFANSDICVVTSRYESFGYVAAEAGAAGLPVVATDVDGLKDVVEDAVTGFLVDGEDCAAFVDRLRTLIEQPDRRAHFGDAARRRVAEHFDVATNARLVRAAYEQLL